jgi:hypothetical protein
MHEEIFLYFNVFIRGDPPASPRQVKSGLVFCTYCMAGTTVTFEKVMKEGKRDGRKIVMDCQHCHRGGFCFELSEETAAAFPEPK